MATSKQFLKEHETNLLSFKSFSIHQKPVTFSVLVYDL